MRSFTSILLALSPVLSFFGMSLFFPAQSPAPPSPVNTVRHEVPYAANGNWTYDRYIPTFDSSLGTLVSIDIDLWMDMHREVGIEVTSGTGRAAFFTSWDQPFNPPSDDQLGAPGVAWWQAQLDLPTHSGYEDPLIRRHGFVGAAYAQGPPDGDVNFDGPSGNGLNLDVDAVEQGTFASYTDQATLDFFSVPASIVQLDLIITHHPSMWVVYETGTSWQISGHSYNAGRIVITYHYTTP